MSTDSLRERIRRRPFRPVTLNLPNGRSVTVTDPALTMFNESGRTLIVTQGDRVILIDVATAEALEMVED